MRNVRASLLGILLATALMTGCAPAQAIHREGGQFQTSSSSNSSSTAGETALSPTALEALAALPIKGRAPKTGYGRHQFGQTWTDDVAVSGGHNGCDQRSDILRRDLLDVVLKLRTQGCVPASGTLHNPYTDAMIAFVRGETTSSEVQIDHVVALSNAWQTGAQQLTAEQRQNLAGDPLELLAVDGATNQSKGDGDAATWLPPNKAFRCPYVARQISVKLTYGLWVTPAEQAAMQQVLTACPNEPLPDETDLAVAVPAPQR